MALEYDKEGRGAAGERIFRPQGVIDHGGVWYVIGHDVGRNAERTFRVDRIMAVRETGAGLSRPGPLDPARFQREQLFFPSGRERPVTFAFRPPPRPWALQRYGPQGDMLDDGRADVSSRARAARTRWASRCSLAGEAEIAAPEEAREALRDEASARCGGTREPPQAPRHSSRWARASPRPARRPGRSPRRVNRRAGSQPGEAPWIDVGADKKCMRARR